MLKLDSRTLLCGCQKRILCLSKLWWWPEHAPSCYGPLNMNLEEAA
jgi:hypothetical protein